MYNSVDEKELVAFIKNPGPVYKTPAPSVPESNSENLIANTENLLNRKAIRKLTVLAFDIYKYSQKSFSAQVWIPMALKDIRKRTANAIKKHESFLFDQNSSNEIPFIDTGDGGFLIFENPLQALVYAVWFQTHLQMFNTNHITPELRKLTGDLIARYTITHDRLVQVQENFYGPAIINAGRIIAKDSLNRFLLDEHSMVWFNENLNGLANICYYSPEEIVAILKELSMAKVNSGTSLSKSLFTLKPRDYWGFKNCDVQFIGHVKTKDRDLPVYSAHIQAIIGLLSQNEDTDNRDAIKIPVTLGNLNPMGLASDP